MVPELSGDESRFNGSALIEMESRGVRAKTIANSLTFGTQNDIVLRGTLSKDLDNRPEELKVGLCY